MAKKIVLFFTEGVALKTWADVGMFERETALYLTLAERGFEVVFVTYGDKSDLDYASQIPDIKIICNKWGLPMKWYRKLIPVWLSLVVRGKWIGKSNQTQGADVGLKAAQFGGQPFIARCGYMLSLFNERRYGKDSLEHKNAVKLEDRVFGNADKVVVTSKEMEDYALSQHSLQKEKVALIPNYVETKIFFPKNRASGSPIKICYVGRLVEKKNPKALLEAIRGLDLTLDIVGGGELLEELKAQAQKDGTDVRFLGNLANHELPDILNNSDIYVHPSLYEGHPKALLEAMACGLPVVATDVPGTREVISHRETGFLCGTSAAEIRQAIVEVLDNQELRTKMGANAAIYVQRNASLDHVLELEIGLFKAIELEN